MHWSYNGGIREVEFYLNKDVDVDTRKKDFKERTPLMLAALARHNEIVEMLIGKGADVKATDSDGITALNLAALYGHDEVIKTLVRNGADVNASDKDGVTALMFAVGKGHVNAVRILIEEGADTNARDIHGSTALRWVADLSKTETNRGMKTLYQKVARVLLSAGATM